MGGIPEGAAIMLALKRPSRRWSAWEGRASGGGVGDGAPHRSSRGGTGSDVRSEEPALQREADAAARTLPSPGVWPPPLPCAAAWTSLRSISLRGKAKLHTVTE